MTMKRNKISSMPLKTVVFLLGMLVAQSGLAERLNLTVETVQELVEALGRCNNGSWTYGYSMITLKAGTYDLTGIGTDAAHLFNNTGILIRGEDATSWRDDVNLETKVILVGAGTKPIFSTNQNAAYWEACRGATFENITFRNGKSSGNGGAIAVASASLSQGCYVVVSNCVFESCVASGNGGGVPAAKAYNCRFFACKGQFGGGMASGEAYDCVFDRNEATHSGGALAYNPMTRRCTFTGNKALYWAGAAFSASLYDCTVVGNSITGGDPAYGGAAVPDNASTIYSGCTFEGNVSTTMGGAISTRGDTAATAKNALITNCTFRANKAGGGGALFNMRNVTNCHFENNTNSYFSGHCWHCTVRNSTVTGEGQMCQTRLENCTFDGAYSSKDASRGVVVSVNNSVMTDDAAETVNCLFVNITNAQMAVDCQGQDMTIVNCTFADSVYDVKGPIRTVDYGGRGPNVKIFNSIFANNVCGGVDHGFWIAREKNVGSLEIRNNLGSVLTIPESVEGCPVTASGNKEGDPKFLGADNRYGVPAYTVRYSSPAHAAGLVDKLPVTVTKDRAGNARLREGQLDLGCYETWYERVGLFLVVQ